MRHLTRSLVFGLLGVLLLTVSVLAELRTWTAASGATIEAEFVKLQAGKVPLKKADGRTVLIGLTQLSASDQAHMKKQTQNGTQASRSSQSAIGHRQFPAATPTSTPAATPTVTSGGTTYRFAFLTQGKKPQPKEVAGKLEAGQQTISLKDGIIILGK